MIRELLALLIDAKVIIISWIQCGIIEIVMEINKVY